MAVPQPILTTINAFDATQGTTINFTITSGDEVVRSSKLYIYDNADGSLICTHIYTSTTRQHILPANTDGSIIYESGKTSADFANEKQFRTAIQLFTGVNGTGNASGVSSPFQQFWCLNIPTLTPASVNTPIGVTSYNFSAIYDTKITSASLNVDNRIQRYQFILYNNVGQIMQTGNMIIGTGTQLTNTTYQISQNFTGLREGEQYYAVITCYSEQGMIVTATTGTILVQIDSVVFNKADVTNNCSDGCITITSNITDFAGETNVPTPPNELTGFIDLRGDIYYVTWSNGFTFPQVQVSNLLNSAQWGLGLWLSAPDKSKYISNDDSNISWVIRLESPEQEGVISLFITQGYDYGSTTLQTRLDLLVTSYQNGATYYAHSDYIDNPSDTDDLYLYVGCIDGMYEIGLDKVS